MKREIFSYLHVAAQIATRGEKSRSFFIGSVGVRSDGALVYAANLKTDIPTRQGHSEYRLARMIDVGSTIYVARITRDGNFALSRPCFNCVKALKMKGARRVYYSISNSEFGRIDLKTLDLGSYKYRE